MFLVRRYSSLSQEECLRPTKGSEWKDYDRSNPEPLVDQLISQRNFAVPPGIDVGYSPQQQF